MFPYSSQYLPETVASVCKIILSWGLRKVLVLTRPAIGIVAIHFSEFLLCGSH